MKRSGRFVTSSGCGKASVDDCWFSKFPKFLELSEQEKKTFYQILNGAREKIDKRKKAESKDLLKSSNLGTCEEDPSETSGDGFSTDVKHFDEFEALSEAEKGIYFATLKEAIGKAAKKKNNARSESSDKGILSVAVNLVSKDNERIQKTEQKKKIRKKTKHLEKEDEEDEEDRLLLNIVGKRQEEDVSTKGIYSEINLAQEFSSEKCLREPGSLIDCGKKISELSKESIILDTSQTRAATEETATEEKERTELEWEKNEADTSARKEKSEEFSEVGDDKATEKENENEKEKGVSLDGHPNSEVEKTVTPEIQYDESKETENLNKKEEEVTELEPDEVSTVTVSFRSSESFAPDEEKESRIREEKVESLDDFSDNGKETPRGEEPKSQEQETVVEDSGSGEDPFPSIETGRESFAEEEERKSEISLLDSEASKTSGESSEETEEAGCVPIYDKKLTAPKSRVRTLQDLLRERAVLVVDSSDRFKIEWLPKDAIPKASEAKEIALPDFDVHEEEAKKEKKKNKLVFFLEKMFACGRKETEKEDAVAENLKGESVSVEMGTRQKNAASATLDDATIEVLEAAKRKRIIARYTKQN